MGRLLRCGAEELDAEQEERLCRQSLAVHSGVFSKLLTYAVLNEFSATPNIAFSEGALG